MRLLFIATAQLESQIFVWDVTTDMLLGKNTIEHVPIVLYLKVADDNKHLLIVVSICY
jgi:hypothetical protein